METVAFVLDFEKVSFKLKDKGGYSLPELIQIKYIEHWSNS